MIGLSPMDGITDAAFRQVVDKIGKPDILFTEFIPVEGLIKGKPSLLNGLKKHKTNTPVIAQFFGSNPDNFYIAYFIAQRLGFSGIDVNMGCPDNSVVKKGGGAALISTPQTAVQILRQLHQARRDYSNGKRLSHIPNLPQHFSSICIDDHTSISKHLKKQPFTISVKTRTGVDKPITKDWISTLLKEKPDYITLHARTLNQKYSGKANWSEITTAVSLAKGSSTQIWGNGDVASKQDAIIKIHNYNVTGVLIGRASLGNPWIFQDTKPSISERIRTILYHANLFLQYRPELDLRPMRKHLAWYWKGMDGSAKVREQLMKVTYLSDLIYIIDSL